MIYRRLAKDSAIYGGYDFLTKLVAFFTFPLIAAALSPQNFGVLELIGTVTALLGIAVNCGLNNSVQRFYWDIDTAISERPLIVTSGLYALVLFSAVAVLVGIAAFPLILPRIESAGWEVTSIGLFAALMLMTSSQWNQYILDVIRLHFAPWRFLSLSLLSRVLSIGLGLVAVVWLGLGIDGLLSAQALVLLVVFPLAVFLIRRDVRLRGFNRKWFSDLVRFGHPFIYAGIAYWLFGSMDRWMLAGMRSVEEVGIYSVAFRFASIVLFVSAAFGQAWSPIAMKIRTDNPENYREIYGEVLLLLLFVMLVAGGGIALFAGEIIFFIMPAEYYGSALPLVFLTFGVVLQSSQQVTAIGISLEKKTYLFARLAWLTAFVNFGLNWVLIPPLGATGAAVATFVSYLLLTISYLHYTQRLHPLMIRWNSLGVLLGLGMIVGVGSCILVSKEFNILTIIIKAVLASVCLFLGLWLLPLKTFRTFRT